MRGMPLVPTHEMMLFDGWEYVGGSNDNNREWDHYVQGDKLVEIMQSRWAYGSENWTPPTATLYDINNAPLLDKR
jgi:hypothetical protein